VLNAIIARNEVANGALGVRVVCGERPVPIKTIGIVEMNKSVVRG
jgi:hypothetical protein